VVKQPSKAARKDYGVSARATFLAPLVGAALIFCALNSPSAAAQSDSAPMMASASSGMRTIVVTGQGTARGTPDLASLNLGIETHAATAQESAGQNAALAQRVVEALNQKLAGRGRVWTGGYSLDPEYAEQRPGHEKPIITGYRADNSITVETGAIQMLGSLIDTAIAAGANRVNYLNFVLRDETSVRQAAIANASRDAQAQAGALAKSLGVKLGPILKATTESQAMPMPMMRMSAMMASAPTPVEPNDVEIPATVSLTYQIE